MKTRKAKASQFIDTLGAVLPTEVSQNLPLEDSILLQAESTKATERFFHRNFSKCSFPVNLYDRHRVRQIEGFVGSDAAQFPQTLFAADSAANGSVFVVADQALYFLYTQIERWPDAPPQLAFVAVKIAKDRLTAVAARATEQIKLTDSEYLLVSHLLAGQDLKAAAQSLGSSYDTKRKQIQIVMEKLGVKSQAALLRTVSLDLSAHLFDELLPAKDRRPEMSLIRRQFGKDAIINNITIGDGIEIPIWEFGARHGRPILFFHSMLTPTLLHHDMVPLLKKHGVRWIVLPRHFLGLEGIFESEARVTKLNDALAETLEYMTDEPLICLSESAGAGWAVKFTAQHPNLIDQLILAAAPQPIAAAAQGRSATIYAELSRRVRQDPRVISGLSRAYNALSRVPAFAQKGLRHLFRQSASDLACLDAAFAQGHLADWTKVIANEGHHAAIDELYTLQQDWVRVLHRIDCAITFFHGDQDPLSPSADIRAIAETCLGATFTELEEAGHFVLTRHLDHILSYATASAKAQTPSP